MPVIYIYTTIKKTRNLFLKKTIRHVSQGSAFNPEHSAFSKIPQNMKYITTTRDSTTFCLSITHLLHFEGGQFDTKFDRKYARLMDQIRRQSASGQRMYG